MNKSKLTKKQTQAIKCAYADLLGAVQARNQQDIEVHNWEDHLVTIHELEDAFSFIDPIDEDKI